MPVLTKFKEGPQKRKKQASLQVFALAPGSEQTLPAVVPTMPERGSGHEVHFTEQKTGLFTVWTRHALTYRSTSVQSTVQRNETELLKVVYILSHKSGTE